MGTGAVEISPYHPHVTGQVNKAGNSQVSQFFAQFLKQMAVYAAV